MWPCGHRESKNLDIAAEIAVVDPCFENLIIEWFVLFFDNA